MYENNYVGMTQNIETPVQINVHQRPNYYQAIKEHLFSEMNDEAVILSLKNGKYYGVNAVGVLTWKTIVHQNSTLDEIVSVVMSRYDIDQDTCRREITAFLDGMLNEELIEIVNG